MTLVTEGLGQQKLVSSMNALPKPTAFEVTRARFGSAHGAAESREQAVWRQWFVDNPQYLYESWGSRMLARELIGLMTFGYKPQFARQELGFHCADAKKASEATFEAYSNALNDLLFHQGADVAAKAVVLEALSNWLFGKPDALK